MVRVSRNTGRRRSRVWPSRLLFPKILQNCFGLESPAILEVSPCRRVPSRPASMTAQASGKNSFLYLRMDVRVQQKPFQTQLRRLNDLLRAKFTIFAELHRDF